MRTTIDAAGRIVVPKRLRERLSLHGGTVVEIDEHDGRIEIRPAPATVRIIESAEGPVAVQDDTVPLLTDDAVREALEQIRQ